MRHCMMNNKKTNNYNIKKETTVIEDFPPLPPLYSDHAPYADAAGPVIISPDMSVNSMPYGMEPQMTPANMYDTVIGGTFNVENFPSVSNPEYLTEFLKSQTGKLAKVEFLLGANTYAERTGILSEIGANYLVLNELGTKNMLTCDLYSVKFVTVYNTPCMEYLNSCGTDYRMI